MYSDYDDLIQQMSNEDAGAFIKAVYDYQHGRLYALPVHLSLAFSIVRKTFERDEARYAKTVEKRKEAAAKRWDGNVKEPMQMYANASTSMQKMQMDACAGDNVSDSDSVNGSDSVSDSDIVSPTGFKGGQEKKEPPKQKKRNSNTPPVAAAPPTLDEVIAFFASKGFPLAHATKAYEYYHPTWVDSRGAPVLNWKQKFIANWMKDSDKGSDPNTVNFSDLRNLIKQQQQ